MWTPCAWSAWQIEYSDTLVQEMARAGAPISKRVGHFATKQECLAAIDEAVARSGDPTLRLHMYPAPDGYDKSGASSSDAGGGIQEPVWGQDGYGIPFYNLFRNMKQQAAERRAQKARDINLKGNEQYSKGNWSEAIRLYREALKVTPEDPVIQQNLKNAEAKEKAYSLNSKGVDAYQYRNWAAAVRSFREALQATPDDPVIQKNLKEAEFWLNSEVETKVFLQDAARKRKIAEAARETQEAEQRKRLAQTDAAFADLQVDALGFLGKPGESGTSVSSDVATSTGPTLGQVRVPAPPSFPVSSTAAIERDSSPVMELPPAVYQIIGLIGQGIKNAPQKFGETVITALGGGSQLGVIKIAKGLSDEAGRSMQNAVDLIGRGYPEAETIDQIKGSETRAMKIYIDSFSSVPMPPSEEEKQEMEINGRKWFKWLTGPTGGSQ
jgi:tetratricopeptide (TPR) repeat protein